MDDDFCLLPEDLSEYIEEHTSPVEALLSALDRDTHVNVLCPRMLSGAYQGKLLEFLSRMIAPERILEVGTAVGFSALLMSTYGPGECRITTIENYEKRISAARENFKKAGKEKQITLLEGDAQKVLKTLEEPFDFIFMDAAKGQYIHFLPDILRLLVKGGILISDNVLQDGDIIQSHFAVERRNRTIYKRMREYLGTLKNSSELETAILPLGDGVALSVRK